MIKFESYLFPEFQSYIGSLNLSEDEMNAWMQVNPAFYQAFS